MQNKQNHNRSMSIKALIIGVLVLLFTIPGFMIQGLIKERQVRSEETIKKINEKWGLSQQITGPVLVVPFTLTSKDKDNKEVTYRHNLYITPEELNITAELFPEKRHYGIYKAILYGSEVRFSGKFSSLKEHTIENGELHWQKAFILFGLSDLRGVTNNLDFTLGERKYPAEAGNENFVIGKNLKIDLSDISSDLLGDTVGFEGILHLNGSSNMSFVPVGHTTNVQMTGKWDSPGSSGNFAPNKYDIEDETFFATWNILSFNKSIPPYWIDDRVDMDSFSESSFGLNLISPVDHYQQNMRSAKYSLMFVILTFAVFFLVEIITKKRIHPIQYLLVGFALILFYSLLLSISEQVSFLAAYIIASIATVALITAYTYSIFKSIKQTGILCLLLTILYSFLYIVLQLEDTALLVGSIGLFVVLAIIMFVSRKIEWYKGN